MREEKHRVKAREAVQVLKWRRGKWLFLLSLTQAVFIGEGEKRDGYPVQLHPSLPVHFLMLRFWFQTPLLCSSVAGPIFGYSGSCSPAPASEPMDSPSSVSSYSPYSLSSSFSTSPVNSDFGFPSDSEGEDKGAHGPRPDTVKLRGGSRPSPGPIRHRQRPKVSSNQHTASHSKQRGLASPMAGSGVKRSRDRELETNLNIQGCTTEGDLLFAQKVRDSCAEEVLLECPSTQLVGEVPVRIVLAPRFGGRGSISQYWCGQRFIFS